MSMRNAVLNPASSPFFPTGPANGHHSSGGSPGFHHGRGTGSSDEQHDFPGAYRSNIRDQEASYSSSTSAGDYKSVRSSPSPPSEDNYRRDEPQPPQQQPSLFRSMAGYRMAPSDSDRPFAIAPTETRAREASLMGTLETLPESPIETPGGHGQRSTFKRPFGADGPPLSSSPSSFTRQYDRERKGTPPHGTNGENSRSSSVSHPFAPASPVSSLGSSSRNDKAVAGGDSSSALLENHLRSMPFIADMLERISRCEISTQEITRELAEVHRKVDMLIDRTKTQPFGSNNSSHFGSMASTIGPTQPEFNDPFAATPGPPPNTAIEPRLSMAAIAPNQVAPTDDISQISQRLNTLTSSVGQLLALQTQQHMHVNNSSNSSPSSGGHSGPETRSAINNNNYHPHRHSEAPLNHSMMHNAASATASMLGHGLPNRPDIRGPSRSPAPPQMRTWSVGNLDLPLRPPPGMSSMNPADAVLKQRRSVTAGMGMAPPPPLGRRESSGNLEMPNEGWAPRDNGPVISKWEQLSLAPDLLRSLAKFGVGPPNKIQQRALPFLLRGSDIIAQAPPTQERIAAYVIPAIQVAVVNAAGRSQIRGPFVIMISTTVDQATQAQRMIRDLGGPIGIRSALGVGTTSNSIDLANELRQLQLNMPHIICGTPQKLHALFTSSGGLSGSEVRFLVLDEVDQLIARNLHDFVFNIVKLLPQPRSHNSGPGATSSPGSLSHQTSTASLSGESSSSMSSNTPVPTPGRRFSTVTSTPNPNEGSPGEAPQPERQTALFSNTVPQDVLNLASAIQLREPVRVLVRRDGNVTAADTSQGSRGLRQFYLYLAFTAGPGRDPMSAPNAGLGIIGSGRGASSAEGVQAREWKLDALADLFEDVEVPQAIIHVGGITALDSVVYKLASRGLEAVPLHGDMNAGARMAAITKFKTSATLTSRPPTTKVLVVYDVQVRTPDVTYVPLVVNYDLPKAVEEYAHRVAPAISSGYSRAGVVVNFVTATGGDVEMLRSIECFYKIKCPEVPMSLRDIV